MARYIGSDCRLCRREGMKLFLKGDRCYSDKCALVHRKGGLTPPGQHGLSRKKATGYAIQLREKQKTKRAYGLLEKQFRMYYEKAEKMRGVTGENMLILIERRLDNVVYRLGLGASRKQARQMVNHSLITVNGRVVNIPSYLIKVGDVVAVKESKKNNTVFAEVKEEKAVSLPKWLEFDNASLTGKVLALPAREDIDLSISEHLIVELYSR
ncbi:MAG: 30S ribosomal protein S4 [Clostridia bacterium]|nr:30S ribosomal protein S4 [Clostridia bacterium]MBR7159835.1 30S ribosomal protein S4 [Clostridia bacterium]